MAEETKSFLGTGWGFPPTFNKGINTVEILSGEEDIQNSLKVLLSTAVGERLMHPNFGCDLSKLLFEPLDTTLKAYMKDLIADSILIFEPRIKMNDIQLKAKTEEGYILITIDYTVRSTNSRTNLVYPYYLKEGTNL